MSSERAVYSIQSVARVGVALLLILTPVWSQLSGGDNGPSRDRDPVRIHLNDLDFDPLTESPSIPAEQRYRDASETRYQIIQFVGKVTADRKAALEKIGVAPLYYVPDDALLVRLDRATLKQIRELEFVRWVGPLEPRYKVSPGLSGRKTPGGEKVRVSLLLGDALVSESVKRNLDGMGAGRVEGAEKTRYLRAEVTPGLLNRIARDPEVIWLEEAPTAKLLNDAARWVIQSGNPSTFATPIHSHGITGSGQKITLSDTGIDVRHQAFSSSGKVSAYYAPLLCGPSGNSTCGDDHDQGVNHGSFTSGVAAGDGGTFHSYDGSPDQSGGVAGPHDGQAFEATLEMQDLSTVPDDINFPNDMSLLFQEALDRGGFIHSTSIGIAPGYGSIALSYDTWLFDHQDYLAIFAGGNDGNLSHTRSLNGMAEAKNIISVGGSQNGPALNKVYCTASAMSCSSRGPSEDGRIKPDLLAPGQGVWSVHACQQNEDPTAFCNDYVYANGTSIATPMVAGAAAMVRGYLTGGFYPSGTGTGINGFTPSAALIKAMLINSATEVTGHGTCLNDPNLDCDTNAECGGGGTCNTGTSGYGFANELTWPTSREEFFPNNTQGWGRILLDDALYFSGDSRGLQLSDHRSGVGTGEAVNYHVTVSDAGQPFEITLVWTDAPPAPQASPKLVNNLDLTVTAPNGTTVFRGNKFTGFNFSQSQADPSGSDSLNNVEGVLLRSGIQTGVYTVQVSGTNVPMGAGGGSRQPFALVATGGIAHSAGVLTLDKAEYVPGDYLRIELIDPDLNVNPAVTETVTVQATSGLQQSQGMWDLVTLTETGPNSTRFAGQILTRASAAPYASNGAVEVGQVDTITVTYQDAQNGLGGSGPVTATAAMDWGQGPVEDFTTLEKCFDGIDNDGDGLVDKDCALDMSSQQVLDGSVTAGTLASLAATSTNQTYEDLTEVGGTPAKLTALWNVYPGVGRLGTALDLSVEGYRSTSSPNDNFLFSMIATGPSCSITDPAWASAATLLTLTKTSDDDQLQAAIAPTWGDYLCLRVLDSNRTTNGSNKDTTPDTLRLDRVFLFPSPVADSDYASGSDMGTIVGGIGYQATTTSNDGRERLQEVGSRLSHTWRFRGVPGGSSHKLRIEGSGTVASGTYDDFKFYWSTNPASWSDSNPLTGFTLISGAVVVGGTGESTGEFTIPATSFPSGVVYIRVIDAQKSGSGSSTNTLSVDHLAIRTVP